MRLPILILLLSLHSTWSFKSPAKIHHLANALRRSIGDHNVFPRNSYGYSRRRYVHNGLCRYRTPDLIVTPRSTLHVTKCVKLARQYYVEISVRSGGHSFICNGIKNEGLHLDMRLMNKIVFGKRHLGHENFAILGPGNNWGRVLAAIPREKYTMVHGTCYSVGLGGYILGGGGHAHGVSDLYGLAATNVIRFTLVTADGNVLHVTKDNVTRPVHSYNGNYEQLVEEGSAMYNSLGAAGPSYGIVTEFVYKVHPRPEPKSHMLYITLEDEKDLWRLEQMYAAGPYHVALYALYLFKKPAWDKELLINYGAAMKFPAILKFLQNSKTDPVIITLVDRKRPHIIDYEKAIHFVQSFGIKLAFQRTQSFAPTNFDINDYESWYMSKEEIRSKGYQAVASANFGSNQMRGLANFLLKHPVFGWRHKSRAVGRRTAGCDFCYIVIHSNYMRFHPFNPNEESFLPILDTNFQFELTCTYEPFKKRACAKMLRRLKQNFYSRSKRLGESAPQYPNTPTCDKSGNFAQRYYGENYHLMLEQKRKFDPDNFFHYCHSVGSTDTNCCPQDYH